MAWRILSANRSNPNAIPLWRAVDHDGAYCWAPDGSSSATPIEYQDEADAVALVLEQGITFCLVVRSPECSSSPESRDRS